MRKTLTVPMALLCIAITILLSACHKESARPTVCAGQIPDTVYINQPVRFTNCSTGASSCQWQFGDSSMAITDTATHTYTQPGTYHGSLTVANTDKSSVRNFTIVVLSDKPGYYIINGKYYRPDIWVNDAEGAQGLTRVYGYQNGTVTNMISFYFDGADQATAGQYITTFGYLGSVHAGEMTMSTSLGDSANIYHSSSEYNTAKVNLDILPFGKRHIYGTDVWMVQFPDRTDSFKVSFDLREP